MKMKLQKRKTGWAVALIIAMAVVQVQAADLAAASGTLAEVESMAVQVKAQLANAAGSGDMSAVAEAASRAAAVDTASGAAQEAYAAMEKALQDGDEDAANAAQEQLNLARQAAEAALNGNTTAPAVASASSDNPAYDEWKADKTNTGSSHFGLVTPNIYRVPWHTEGMQSLYSSLFDGFWTANGTSLGGDYTEQDATEI